MPSDDVFQIDLLRMACGTRAHEVLEERHITLLASELDALDEDLLHAWYARIVRLEQRDAQRK